jgi:hypothetical protein
MSSCSKISHPTRTAAGLALRAITRKYAGTDRKVPRGAYHCKDCKSWHLTSRINVQIPQWAETITWPDRAMSETSKPELLT